MPTTHATKPDAIAAIAKMSTIPKLTYGTRVDIRAAQPQALLI